MNLNKVLTAISIAAIALFVAFYYVNLAHTYKTCDGQVVNNTFDWPVCVH